MDNNTRSKYLNALIKTINNLDDATFNQRVNDSRNDYADWIKKNLPGDGLHDKITSLRNKQAMIATLKSELAPTTVATSVAATNVVSTPAVSTSINASAPQVALQVPNIQTNVFVTPVTRVIPATQTSVAPIVNVTQTVPVTPAVPAQQSAEVVQKIKYIGALIKTISNLTDELFSQRVNDSANQYADWVMKNMHDQELSSKLKPVRNKNTMIELLRSEISNVSKPVSTRNVVNTLTNTAVNNISTSAAPIVTSAASIVTPSNTTLVTSSNNVNAVKPVIIPNTSVVHRKTDDATTIKYLNALIKTINTLTDDTFKQRVNDSTNQYADWVTKNIGDEMLSKLLRSNPNKSVTISILKSNIDSIQHPVQNASVSINAAPTLTTAAESATSTLAPAITGTSTVTSASTTHAASVDTSSSNIAVKKPVNIIPASNEPISIKTTSTPSISSEGGDTKISAQDLFKKLKRSRDEKTLAGIISPKVTPMLNKPKVNAVLAKNYNSEVDLIKMSARQIIEKLKIIDYSKHDIAIEEDLTLVKKEIKRLKTGVPGFDEMIGAGIPEGSVILASGGPGSGKTTFCIQMLGWAAERGEKCLFISLEETTDRLIEHMESYGLNPKKYLAEGTLMVQQQDPFKISRSIEALLAHGRGELLIDIESILDIIPKGFKPDRVVIDSLSAIASAFNESNTAYRIYVNQLINLLAKTGATSFLITEVQGIENIGHGLVEEFLADGVIVFYNLQRGNIKQSALEILKMRAVNHEKKIVPFEFVEGKGLLVYPLEKVFL